MHDDWRMTMQNVLLRVLMVGALSALCGCGGESALGEECGESGAEAGECEQGSICGKPTDSSENLVCIKVCKEDTDCPSGESCNGVEGASVKGCRDKTVK